MEHWKTMSDEELWEYTKPDPAKFLPVPFRMNSLQLPPHHPEDALNNSFREMPNIIRSTGLLRRPQGTSWKPVLSKLLEPWHAVHPQKSIHGPTREDAGFRGPELLD